jgi:hypothetical protein
MGWVVLVRGPGMIEAAKTTASAGAIWAIVIVAVLCLAFWLGMVAWADAHPVWRRHELPEMQGSVLGGIHRAEGGRSVAPDRYEAAIDTEGLGEVPAQRVEGEPGMAPAAAYGPGAGMGPAVPTQRRAAAGQPQPAGTGQDVPGQRGGEGDRPEQSGAGQGGTDRRGLE